MKKNRVALILLLVAFLSCPAFSDEGKCRIEFEMGAFNAKNQTSIAPWAGISLFIVMIGSGVGVWVHDALYERDWWDITDSWCIAALIGSGAGIAVSMAVPIATKPKPKVIPEDISKENVQCYLDGYTLSARKRRIIGASMGCLLGVYFFSLFPLAHLLHI